MSRMYTEDEISLLMEYVHKNVGEPVSHLLDAALQGVEGDQVEELLYSYPQHLRESADTIQRIHENLESLLDSLASESTFLIERSTKVDGITKKDAG